MVVAQNSLVISSLLCHCSSFTGTGIFHIKIADVTNGGGYFSSC